MYTKVDITNIDYFKYERLRNYNNIWLVASFNAHMMECGPWCMYVTSLDVYL